jgi:phosphatidylinositol alpha-1,6-mannosyltransferase
LLRWALRRARRLPAISSYTGSKVRAEIGSARTTVVPLGVNAPEFAAPDPAPARDRALVLSVGELKPRKGLDLVLRAVARLRSEIPDLRYVIVGPCDEASPYVRQLRRDIEELALSDIVTLTGPVSHADLVEWYHRAGLVVMPYREARGDIEGFGLVLLEAGAAGTPVVSTRRSGAEQPVRHDLNGLLVEPDDVEALGAAMRKLLTDAEIWRRLADGGGARAAKMSWERSTDRLLNVYAETLGAPLVAA